MTIEEHIKLALEEDLGDGDHTSLSTIPSTSKGKAKLIAKQDGIIAGIRIAEMVFKHMDPELKFKAKKKDGEKVKAGDVVLTVKGKSISILSAERLALNYMQRMSGIATSVGKYKKLMKGTKTTLLDTRKTTPLMRLLEKEAVRLGGGKNHRMGLYDMVMIKDNHIDFAGGVVNAIKACNEYLKDKDKDLKIEIEIRSFEELQEALDYGGIHRILLDNFTPEDISKALVIINGRYETEASGNINKKTIRSYAETGVDFISSGALTHHIRSLDLSLLADLK